MKAQFNSSNVNSEQAVIVAMSAIEACFIREALRDHTEALARACDIGINLSPAQLAGATIACKFGKMLEDLQIVPTEEQISGFVDKILDKNQKF